MTWDEVETKIKFWQDGAWSIELDHEPSEVPATEQDYILDTIKAWFENPAYSDAKNAVEAVIDRYGFLRIGHSDLGGFTMHPMGTNDAYITLDTNNDPLDHYLTPNGYWQANELYISLLHEIMHLGLR